MRLPLWKDTDIWTPDDLGYYVCNMINVIISHVHVSPSLTHPNTPGLLL